MLLCEHLEFALILIDSVIVPPTLHTDPWSQQAKSRTAIPAVCSSDNMLS